MDILNIILAIISVIGVAGTFYFGLKAAKLAREKHRYSWIDIVDGCKNLHKRALKRFKPDIIVSFSGPSSIVANLIIEYSNFFVPLYIVVLEKFREKKAPKFIIPDYHQIVTSKWRLHIPDALVSDTSKKVMVVDDCVISGDSLLQVKQALIDQGFSAENIHTCSLFCSDIAKETNKSPNTYCYLIRGSDFFVPWGKGY